MTLYVLSHRGCAKIEERQRGTVFSLLVLCSSSAGLCGKDYLLPYAY